MQFHSLVRNLQTVYIYYCSSLNLGLHILKCCQESSLLRVHCTFLKINKIGHNLRAFFFEWTPHIIALYKLHSFSIYYLLQMAMWFLSNFRIYEVTVLRLETRDIVYLLNNASRFISQSEPPLICFTNIFVSRLFIILIHLYLRIQYYSSSIVHSKKILQ